MGVGYSGGALGATNHWPLGDPSITRGLLVAPCYMHLVVLRGLWLKALGPQGRQHSTSWVTLTATPTPKCAPVLVGWPHKQAQVQPVLLGQVPEAKLGGITPPGVTTIQCPMGPPMC